MPPVVSDPSVVRSFFKKPPRWPIIYTLAVFGAMALTFMVSLRREGIFACPAHEYARGYYLGYCNGRSYGDYDHGAFWFSLEPKAVEAAKTADILFIGSSRLPFGFSAPALGKWSAAVGVRYYLLGFSHFENATFAEPLLRELKPKARVYVINLDDFFIDKKSDPANDVMHVADARERYVAKRLWQIPHQLACGRLPFLCGKQFAFYRYPETGEWRLNGNRGLVPQDAGSGSPVDENSVARQKGLAVKFLAGLRVERRCIFMTYVPTVNNQRATAEALATALGFEFISPQIEGLRTFDGSHLSWESAERLVTAFLEIGQSRFRQCLKL